MRKIDKDKRDFISLLIEKKALLFGDFVMKSGRKSPYFLNISALNDGESISKLGNYYASALIREFGGAGEKFDYVLYGIPEKGVGLAISTAIALAERDLNVPWFFTRKLPKTHGEGGTLIERINKNIVGRVPCEGDKIVQLDDVFTAGNAKYNALSELKSYGNFIYPALLIAVDRQEVDDSGNGSVREYEKKTGIKVISIVNACEIFQVLNDSRMVSSDHLNRMKDHMEEYGSETVHRVAMERV